MTEPAISPSPVRRPPEPELILEGIVVSCDAAGRTNIAPMGPRVDRDVSHLVLRPFPSSQTFRNLRDTRCGVLHVTDDVDLFAQAALGAFDELPPLAPLAGFACPRLAETCRWFAFEVASLDLASERATLPCRVVARGELRPFFGFNRAKHAVLEAAILATRIGILPADEIRQAMLRLAPLVQKTAGEQERRAFTRLERHIADRLDDVSGQ